MGIEELVGVSPESVVRICRLSSYMLDALKVHDSFLTDLLKQDDWSFIIKTHAVIEAALNHILSKHFATHALEKVIADLDTSNLRTGKVAFIRAFDLLPKEDIAFIQVLSELRNRRAHNAKNFGFTLKQHVDSLDEPKRRSWVAKITFEVRTFPKYKPNQAPLEDPALTNPRDAVFNAFIMVLSRALEHDIETGETMHFTPNWETMTAYGQSNLRES